MSSKETAILAGGCFWGMQDLVRKLPGVVSRKKQLAPQIMMALQQ